MFAQQLIITVQSLRYTTWENADSVIIQVSPYPTSSSTANRDQVLLIGTYQALILVALTNLHLLILFWKNFNLVHALRLLSRKCGQISTMASSAMLLELIRLHLRGTKTV